MQLKDVMTTDVQLADPTIKLREAASMMRDGDFGLLPVGGKRSPRRHDHRPRHRGSGRC
jgi:CBS domain-containing protein